MKKYLVFIGIGFELIAVVLASLWVGLWIERHYPMKQLWPVLLVVLALAGWFYRVILLLKKLNSTDEK